MNNEQKHRGFSLTEVLLSVGVFSIGMIFIAGVFPVAIHFTTIATERTLAAVVADEAFAKIKLYGIDFNSPPLPADSNTCVNFNDVSYFPLNPGEFAYPSDPNIDILKKQYYWSALCRRVDLSNSLVQVTVFVSRKTGASREYWCQNSADPNFLITVAEPVPIPVNVSQAASLDELWINDFYPGIDEKSFINDGYTIVDGETGQFYRVLERYADDPGTPAVSEDEIILLDRVWQGSALPGWVWVVPSPANGGRYPCKAVYQKVISF